jgi:hypothetical protein
MLLASCQTSEVVLQADPEVEFVLAHLKEKQVSADDRLQAFSPEKYLSRVAGHGVEGGPDPSATCGCADTGGSGPGVGPGPGTTPIVDHALKAHLKITVHVPK